MVLVGNVCWWCLAALSVCGVSRSVGRESVVLVGSVSWSSQLVVSVDAVSRCCESVVLVSVSEWCQSVLSVDFIGW